MTSNPNPPAFEFPTDPNQPECERCGKRHRPLDMDRDYSKMEAGEFNPLIEAMSVYEFLCYFPGVNEFSGFLGVVSSTMHPWIVTSSMACIFGTIAFDAEMQVALKHGNTETALPSLDDRLALFAIIVRKFYAEMGKVSAKNPQMYHHESGGGRVN